MDLYSAKANQLRADLAEARTALLNAEQDFQYAIGIEPDTNGQHVAAESYHLAVEAYREAMIAWVQHVLNS